MTADLHHTDPTAPAATVASCPGADRAMPAAAPARGHRTVAVEYAVCSLPGCGSGCSQYAVHVGWRDEEDRWRALGDARVTRVVEELRPEDPLYRRALQALQRDGRHPELSDAMAAEMAAAGVPVRPVLGWVRHWGRDVLHLVVDRRRDRYVLCGRTNPRDTAPTAGGTPCPQCLRQARGRPDLYQCPEVARG